MTSALFLCSFSRHQHFFFSISQRSPTGLFWFLSLVLIAITLTFIVGGRTKVKEFYVQVVDPPNTPSTNTMGNRVNLPPSQQPANPVTLTPPAAPPPNPQPAPFQPQWDKAQHMAIEDFLWVSAPCIKRAAYVHCIFRVTNLGKSVKAELCNHDWNDLNATRMIDDQGNVYVASAVNLGSSDSTSRAQNDLPSNVPIMGSAVFENVTVPASPSSKSNVIFMTILTTRLS